MIANGVALALALAATTQAPLPTTHIFASLGGCCSICCCGLMDANSDKPPAASKAEVPPPPAASSPTSPATPGNGPNPPPVSSATPASPSASSSASSLALASLAAGRIDEVIVQLADDDPLAVRLTSVRREMHRGVDARTAIWRVYGAGWASRPERAEIVALLAGRDEKFRWRLSSLAHADVKTDWPHGTETAAADAIRVELRRALPDGADDDGARGYVLTQRMRLKESPHDNALIQGTAMKSYELTFEDTLVSVDGAEIAHYTNAVHVLGISEQNAVEAYLRGDKRTQSLREIVDGLVGHMLTDAEVAARKSAS